jgi:hypothetical protein
LAAFDSDLLKTARRLLTRDAGQKGKLPAARIRRSISTSYYSLFHFPADEAGVFLIGSGNKYRRQRRALARAFTHAGLRTAFGKAAGAFVDRSVADLVRGAGSPGGRMVSPPFIRRLATVFLTAQSLRHDADYDLNRPISAVEAHLLADEVEAAMSDWITRPPSDNDLKRALCLLMLLKGQLRREN